MNKPILSLVIPIFNAERFLGECLLSVQAQLEPGCEVVLVDDGSTDASVNIILSNFPQALAKSEFILVRIPNSGPGEARNVGVRAAHGDYIGFLDSDDLLLPEYFQKNLQTIAKWHPRVIQFHCTRFRTGRLDEATTITIHRSAPGLYPLAEIRNDIFGVGKWFPCARVFSRDLLLQHPFPRERVFYEDLMTLPFIFLTDVPIVLLNVPLVAYRDNEQGTTRNHQPAHLEILRAFWERVSQLPKSVATDALTVQLARTIIYFVTELRLKDISVAAMIETVRQIRCKRKLSTYLGRGDRLFLQFPNTYFYGERFRHALGRCRKRHVGPMMKT